MTKQTSVLNVERLREVSKWEVNGPNLGLKTLHEIHEMLPYLLDRIEELEAKEEKQSTHIRQYLKDSRDNVSHNDDRRQGGEYE